MGHRALRRGSTILATAIALQLGSAVSAHAAGVAPASATPVQREQAQGRFLKGRELYGAGKYEAALEELRASLDIVASPNTRLYVGRSLREMGRIVAAYVELGRTAVEAKELLRDDARYEKAAQTATEERAQLAPKLGFVQVTVTNATPETTLRIAGDEVRRGGWDEPFPVVPGTAEIVVDTAGRAPAKRELAVKAGDRKTIVVDAAEGAPLAPTVAEGGPAADTSDVTATRAKYRPVAIATAGLAVAGLATFIVAGAMANSTYSDLERDCGAGPCPPGREGDISSGKTQQTLANVGLAVFAISGAASVTLFVIGSPKTAAAPAPTTARVSVGPSFVGLRGSF